MQLRGLGSLRVPAIGFGAMVLSPGLYAPIDDESATLALRHAIDIGCTFIDTSDGYGRDAHNERLIGTALEGRRDEIVIATKFGYNVPPGVQRHAFQVSYGTLAVNAEPQHVRGFALASLQRLRTDYIDLYYPHFPDPTVPIEETVGAIAGLVAEGLVRHIGLSNVSAAQLEAAVAVHEIAAVQCEWSLWTPIDPQLLAAAQRHCVGIVAWSPLGGGLLASEMTAIEPTDLRHRFPRYADANLANNNDRFAPVRTLARELGMTSGQLALAWLLHQHPSAVPIPGSRTPAHISENVAAAAISLSRDVLALIDDALKLFQPVGGDLLSTPPVDAS